MSNDDELPQNDPLMFNTFSGTDIPIDEYGLLSQEEADKNLSENDKKEYEDPDFDLVKRSRIWNDVKNSVAERREMYKERVKLREDTKQQNEEQQYEDEEEEEEYEEIQKKKSYEKNTVYLDYNNNDNDDNNGGNSDDRNDNKIENKMGNKEGDNNNNNNKNHNNQYSLESESKETQPTNTTNKEEHDSFENVEENPFIFANPFTPLQEPMNNNNNNNNDDGDDDKQNDYAIPFDLNDNNNNNNNNNNNDDNDNDNNGNDDNEDEDIWKNWKSPFGDDNDSNNDSNDDNVQSKDMMDKPRKVRKSEVFADPFHWDTDDENNNEINNDNNNSDDDNNNDNKPDLEIQKSLLDIDITEPFKDPFHGTPTNLSTNGTPSNDEMDNKNNHDMIHDMIHDMKQDINDNDELFANPFNIIKDDDENENIGNNDNKHEDLLRLLFGTDDKNDIDNNMNDISFANPFQQNNDDDIADNVDNNEMDNNEMDKNEPIILSPMVQIKPLSENTKTDSFAPTPSSCTNSPFKISTTPVQSGKPPLLQQLTPVPTTFQKRESGLLNGTDIDNKLDAFDEHQETDVFPDINSKKDDEREKKYDSDRSDGKDDEKEEIIKNVASKPVLFQKEEDSLDFSSIGSEDELYGIIHEATPPPAKTMTDELYELLATLLAKTMAKPRAFYMVDGVPWQKWKCLDWPQHIKQPSTLTQVRNALDNNEYETPGQFAESVRNVFRNYTTYHWKGAGQYRVDTRANILWEEFNIEYFQVLADESEERKREESRRRAIDEARQLHDSREREFSKTHSSSDDDEEDEDKKEEQEEEEEEEDDEYDVDIPLKLQKHVSFASEVTAKEVIVDEETEKEFYEMARYHAEMSQHLSTNPNTPAYTPQPPFFDRYTSVDEQMPNQDGLGLEPLFSQRELQVTPDMLITPQTTKGIQPEISRKLPASRNSSIASSVGAVSLNSRHVRFQSAEQAQRALVVSNVLQRQDSDSRSHSMQSLTSLSRKYKKKEKTKKFPRSLSRLGLLGVGGDNGNKPALLARISSNVPFGFDPTKRRGSIIRAASSHGSSPKIEPDSKKEEDEDGKKRRESKELINEFSPSLRAIEPNKPFMNDIKQMNFAADIPEPHSNIKFHFLITTYLSILIVVYMINYRLFSDQKYPFLYPMTNIGARIMTVFTEPLFIISVLGTMIVIHLHYKPNLISINKKTFIAIFIIANILNILKVSLSDCTMDFIYNLYIYFIIISIMIVPFFFFTNDEKWKEGETVLLLFMFWISMILIGFIYLILHQYFVTFILIIFYLLMIAWIVRFFYYKSLGVFDNIGNLSSKYNASYGVLLIPALLLFPQFGSAIIVQLSNVNISYSFASIYGYYILLKITFWAGRGLWESTALKGTDHLKYIHLMFPIFFIEELIDTILLIKLKMSYEIIGVLIIMAANHMIRDSDIGYRVFYKKWSIPYIIKLYYDYHHGKHHKRAVRSQSHHQHDKHDNNNNEEQVHLTPQSDDREHREHREHTEHTEHTEPTENTETTEHIELEMSFSRTKELNLGQERDDIHLARIILHFQMLRFAEYSSRFAVLLLLIIDIICDKMHIGNRLLLIENGTINETNRGFLVLLCFISIIMIFIANLVSKCLLSRQALTSIQFLDKIECIEDFSYNERLFIHQWVIFGDECKIFKRFWIFFSFIIGYQLIIILQAFFANNGLVSNCHVFY